MKEVIRQVHAFAISALFLELSQLVIAQPKSLHLAAALFPADGFETRATEKIIQLM